MTLGSSSTKHMTLSGSPPFVWFFACQIPSKYPRFTSFWSLSDLSVIHLNDSLVSSFLSSVKSACSERWLPSLKRLRCRISFSSLVPSTGVLSYQTGPIFRDQSSRVLIVCSRMENSFFIENSINNVLLHYVKFWKQNLFCAEYYERSPENKISVWRL